MKKCQPYGDNQRLLLLLDENKIKLARKPGKKHREKPVGCTGEDKI